MAAAAAALARSGGGFLVVVPSAFIKCGSRRILPLVSSSTDLPLLRSTSNEKASGGYDCRLFSPSSFPYTCSRRAGRTYSSTPHTAAVETNEEASVRPPPSSSEDSDPVKAAADALDIRVGRILRAWRHPEADSLYVEEVDVGEPEPRTICSGLVNYITLDRLQDIKVVVLANLKPRNMRGIKSNGMLMAASDASHETVELLVPPEGSVPGERIWFGAEEEKGKQQDAATPNQVQKKKIWESIQPHLKTTDTCIVVLGVHPMRTSAGVVACTSLKDANIS